MTHRGMILQALVFGFVLAITGCGDDGTTATGGTTGTGGSTGTGGTTGTGGGNGALSTCDAICADADCGDADSPNCEADCAALQESYATDNCGGLMQAFLDCVAPECNALKAWECRDPYNAWDACAQ